MSACPEHKGHRRYVGGPLDGEVDHLVYAHASDFPMFCTYPMRDNAMYERDLDGGTEAVYRYVGQDQRLIAPPVRPGSDDKEHDDG